MELLSKFINLVIIALLASFLLIPVYFLWRSAQIVRLGWQKGRMPAGRNPILAVARRKDQPIRFYTATVFNIISIAVLAIMTILAVIALGTLVGLW